MFSKYALTLFLIVLIQSVSAGFKFKFPRFRNQNIASSSVSPSTDQVPEESSIPAVSSAEVPTAPQIVRSQIRDLGKHGILEEFGSVKYRIKASMKEKAPGDGNCLFHSVVQAIASQKSNHPKQYSDLPTMSANDLRQAGVDYLTNFYQKQATEDEKVQMDKEVRNTHFADVQSGWGSFLASKEMNFIIPTEMKQQYADEVHSLKQVGYGNRKAREMFISEVGEPISNVVSYCKYMSLRPGKSQYFAVRLNQAKRYHPEKPWHLPVHCESVKRCPAPIWGDTLMIKALASMLKREILVILKVERTDFFAMRYEPEWGVDQQDKTLYPLVITMDASDDYGGNHYNPMSATIRLATGGEVEDARLPETLPAPTTSTIFNGFKKKKRNSKNESIEEEEDASQESEKEENQVASQVNEDATESKQDENASEEKDNHEVDPSSVGCFGKIRKNKKELESSYV